MTLRPIDRFRVSVLGALSCVALLALGACSSSDSSSGARSESGKIDAQSRPAFAPPTTRKATVTDAYHGVVVREDYRWLEDWNSPEVQAWSEAQNAYARAHLDQMPCVPLVRERVTELEHSATVQYHGIRAAGGRFFAMKNEPPKQQPLIVVLDSVTDLSGEKVVLDLNQLDPSGSTAADWFFPSPDGKLIAVSLSSGGSESGDARIFEVDTGRELKNDTVARVQGGTAGGWLAWLNDSSGFYVTRYPRPGERPEADLNFYTQVYFHPLARDNASPQPDRFEIGKDYPKIAEIVIETSADSFPGGAWVLTNVQNGDGGEFIQDLRSPDGVWTRLSKWDDRIVEAKFGPDNAVYLVSRKNAPNGKVLRLALNGGGGKKPALADAKEIIAERADASIETSFFERTGIFPAKSRLYVQYQVGGPNELRVFDLAGQALGVVEQPPVSTIEGIDILPASNDIVYEIDSFITPPAWYVLNSAVQGASVGTSTKTPMAQPNPPGMPELKVTREFATSKDGTKVPISIVTRADATLNTNTPTVLWGYGGYGVNETPTFSRRRLVWVEQGCTFAVANIRGGGEYGEKWHLGGNLLNKQNCFNDFAACAKHLVSRGYTSTQKLAIMGGSNGGLLMGATITQNPAICKAVVSNVGIYDMLRVELSPNGLFNITEFGTVKNPQQFRALYAYSPYHNVKNGVDYPNILFMTGANDPRVDPMQSRKFVARMQEAEPTGLFLLRTSSNTGHGMGTPLAARIEQTVDQYAFLFDQLGVNYKARSK